MNSRHAMSQYRDVRAWGRIADASPTRLIQLMYEELLAQLIVARGCVQRLASQRQLRDVTAKAAAISKINGILGELLGCLNQDAGRDIAKNLLALYTYMMRRVTFANLNDDIAALEEVERLVRQLKSGWDQIVSPAA